MSRAGGIINKLGRARLGRSEIKDGLDFLIEKAPEDFRCHLDADTLAERYSDETIKEARGESEIRTVEEWKEIFLSVYGLEVYGSPHPGEGDPTKILELVEPYVVVSTNYSHAPTGLSVIQPGITPLRAIRMATLSDQEFDELLRLMPIAVINNRGAHLLEGNNRALQAHYRKKELPAVQITLRNNIWGQNLNLALTKQRRHISETYGATGIEALQTSLYQRMIEDSKG